MPMIKADGQDVRIHLHETPGQLVTVLSASCDGYPLVALATLSAGGMIVNTHRHDVELLGMMGFDVAGDLRLPVARDWRESTTGIFARLGMI